jgi:hypothetical protein
MDRLCVLCLCKGAVTADEKNKTSVDHDHAFDFWIPVCFGPSLLSGLPSRRKKLLIG